MRVKWKNFFVQLLSLETFKTRATELPTRLVFASQSFVLSPRMHPGSTHTSGKVLSGGLSGNLGPHLGFSETELPGGSLRAVNH